MKQTNYALKHTYQLRSMASTLCMCTTISPRQWQPWTAVSPLLGRENLHIKDLSSTAKASAKHSFKQQLVGNCKSKTAVPQHAYGDGIRKIDLCAPKDFETTKCDP